MGIFTPVPKISAALAHFFVATAPLEVIMSARELFETMQV